MSLFGAEWRQLHSRSWQWQEHITALECRAYNWCVQHLTRSERGQGNSYLLVRDIMANVLALSKGRT
eukprot:11845064-Karenia_brevis.AAC.1